MGQVIPFQPHERAAVSKKPLPAEGATILFFLGVRYVRNDDAQPPTLEKARRSSRSRKKRRA